MNEMILLKLGEMVLKGLNRHSFEDKLQANIHRRLNGLGRFRVYTRQSTTYVEPMEDSCDMDAAWEAMKKVFGVVGLSRARACDKDKDAILRARGEDVRIIHSPVGMPGRALNTPLVQALAEGKRFPPKHCARCLKTCDPAAVPYCITHALIEAVKGNVEEGLFFCGENVGRLDRMRTVRELMDELVTEWRQNL